MKWKNSAILVGISWLLLSLAGHSFATICVRGDTYVRWVRGVVLLNESGDHDLPIPGATITLSKGNWSRSVFSDEDGYFSFPELPPGNYDLLAELEGFIETRSTIRVRPNIEGGRALVVDMTIDFNDCGFVEQRPWREVRDLQLR